MTTHDKTNAPAPEPAEEGAPDSRTPNRFQRAMLRMLTSSVGDNPSPAGPATVGRPRSARDVRRRSGTRGDRAFGRPRFARARVVRELLPMPEAARGPKGIAYRPDMAIKNAARRAARKTARDQREATKRMERGMRTEHAARADGSWSTGLADAARRALGGGTTR